MSDLPSPLSPHQERFWFLQRLDPADASYNIYWVHRLHGPLDPDALGRALDALVARHEVLRTRYPERDGVPAAETAPPAPVPVERLDVTAGGIEAAHALVRARVATPFDLAAGAPLRISLLRLGEREHVLCLVLHHIAGDGWSMRVLGGELSALYQAFADDKPSPLPPLALTHGQYAAELAAAADDGRALAYWTGHLAGVPDLELPTDLPRAAVRATTGGIHRAAVPAELMAAADRLAREHRSTAFMVLLAAYQVLLARHSGQRDFCVGTPVAGRTRLEHEGLVGCLAGTVALRADLSGEPTFHQLVDRVRAASLGAFGHQQVPFAELMRALDVARDRSRTPLFQTMFALQHAEPGGLALGGATGAFLDLDHGQAKCDLALEIWRSATGTECHLTYSDGLFTAATAERLTARYLTLLRSLLDAPDRPVHTAELLPEAERAELVARTAGGPLPAAELPTAPARFLDRARRTPDATALHGPAGDLSYAELAAQSARVADRLRAHGVGPGSVVGVFVERSEALPAALLGVWRTGAAYLPLDPQHAAARGSLALADAGAACVLVTGRTADRLPADTPVPVVHLPEPGESVPDPGRPDHLPGPEDPAYVIYTSGSTGRPKGVAVGHGALAAFLDATAARVGGAGPDACWLQLTSISFDISGLEIHLPLTTGGRLVVPTEEDVTGDGRAVVRLAADRRVTHLQATPSGWQLLLAAGFTGPQVTALAGGEALPLPLAAELRRRSGRLFNMYGPTETTIWSACWEVPEEPAAVSLGAPIPGTDLRVLDADGGLCPVGVPGELHIGGAGLALGYLGRPDLTAERFTTGADGVRRYRTGDLVRHREDGGLEFLGRLDHQVKVRGHRVELGELEALLLAAPGVRQSAAALHGDTLVGYVTGTADPADLRARLAAALPGYAVPAAVLVLDALPTTPNGKLDRKALPAPPRRDAPAAEGHAYTGRSAELHRIWCEVLGVDAVGPDEDLFDLGGHSLVIARIAARVRDRLGTDLPLDAFFDTPTIRSLGALLEVAP
ncbi:amino acid adenylation domain-containing protein [Kitasatospora cinereorecta]|uniref:Amino acid adenylation domain-containing protein n=1 Tax=Kitasatospora cinereorecta TaxID=285560 RepID=A0ABW0VIC1_9ACTN